MKLLTDSYRTKIARGGKLFSLLFSNGFGTAAGQAAQIIAIPIQIQSLGTANFGLLALFLSLVAASTIADGGIGSTTLRFVARSAKRPKLTEYVLASGITAILIIGIGIGLLAQAMGLIYALAWGDGSGTSGRAGVALIAVLVSAAIVMSMLANVGMNTLRALRQYRTFAISETTYKLLQPLVLTIVALTTGDITAVLFYYCIVIGVYTLIILVLAARLAGVRLMLTFNFHYFRRRMLNFSKWVWVQSMFGYLGSQADRFVVAGFLGLEVLGFYSVAMSVANSLLALASAAAGFLLPEVARRLGRHDWLVETFRYSTFLLSTVSATANLAITPVAPFVLGLWLGSDNAAQVLPFAIPLLWAASSMITSIPATQFLNAMGRAQLGAMIGMFSNFASLASLIILGWLFGASGIIAAKLLALPLGLAARTIVIDRVFKLQRPALEALSLTWPVLFGTIISMAMLQWVIHPSS